MTNKEFLDRFTADFNQDTRLLTVLDSKTNKSLTFTLSSGDIQDLKCMNDTDDYDIYAEHLKERIRKAFDVKIDKEKVLKKWAPIIESLNNKDSGKKEWMSEMSEFLEKQDPDNIMPVLPIVRRVLKEIGDNDIVTVNPVKEDRLIIQDDKIIGVLTKDGKEIYFDDEIT